MRLLLLSQLRYLRIAPLSTLTVLLGILLSVSSMVAVHQIGQRVVASLEAVVPPHLQAVSFLLDRPGLRMNDYFSLRARWRAGELPGVTGMMPLVEGEVEAGGRRMRLVGADAFSGVAAVYGLAVLAPGELMAGPDSGFPAGGTLWLNGVAHTVAWVHDALPDGLLVADIGTAQEALGVDDGTLQRIAVVVDDGATRLAAWAERFMPGLSAGLPLPGWSLAGWRVRPLAAEVPSLSFARSVLFNLGALGTLALVVAWLLIYQVSVIWLRRRQLTLLRLRQMGVSEVELATGFLLGLMGLGVAASVPGIWLGDALAGFLSGEMTGYGRVAGEPPPLDVWVVGKALVSALLVCFLGGVSAIRREKWEARQRNGPWGGRWRVLAALWMAAAGVAGLLAGDSLLGGFAAIAAVALLVLMGIGPVLVRLRGVSRRLRGSLLARMGFRELVWYPGDLSVAVGALVLALASSIAMAAMVDSFRGDFRRLLEQRLVHDLFVDGRGRNLGPLADALEALPGVTRVQRYGSTEALLSGRRVVLGYGHFDAAESRRYGLSAPLAPGRCLVSERLARDLRLEAGDEVRVLGRRLAVAGIFPDFGEPNPRVLVGTGDARRMLPRLVFDRLSVDARDPRAVAQRVVGEDAGILVRQQGAVRDRALRIFDQTFAITRALTLLALLVAAVGLYNALLALELLQRDQRMLLRALGVSRNERRRMAAWRVAALGVTVFALALPLGLVMGWLLCEVINPRAFGWRLNFAPGAGAILWPGLAALAAMSLAGLLPVPMEEGGDDD